MSQSLWLLDLAIPGAGGIDSLMGRVRSQMILGLVPFSLVGDWVLGLLLATGRELGSEVSGCGFLGIRCCLWPVGGWGEITAAGSRALWGPGHSIGTLICRMMPYSSGGQEQTLGQLWAQERS